MAQMPYIWHVMTWPTCVLKKLLVCRYATQDLSVVSLVGICPCRWCPNKRKGLWKTISLHSQKKMNSSILMCRLCDSKPTVFLRLALPWSDLAFSKICTNSALIMIHFVYNVTEMKWKFNAHTSTMTCMDWRFKKKKCE